MKYSVKPIIHSLTGKVILDNDRDVVVSAKNKSLSEILTSVLKPKGELFYSGEIDCGYTSDFGCPTKYGEGSGSK